MRLIFMLMLMGMAVKAMPQVISAEYFMDDATVPFGKGTLLTVPVNTGDVTITATLQVSDLSPGYHQVFFRVKDAAKGWSTITHRIFLKPFPLDTILGFKYSIDPQATGSKWTYEVFPSPSRNVDYALEINLGDLSKGIHYIEAMAYSNSGAWTPVSKGTFFSLYSEPLNITSLEYCFEAEDSSMSALYTTSDFDPSPDVTLDSVTFTLPVTSLENLKSYFMYIRGVDETGNKGPFVCDTIVYHGTTGLKDRVYLTPELMIFPNPATDLVYLKFITLSKTGDYTIRISDEAGRIMAEKELNLRTDESFTLETGWLAPGLYRIDILSPNGRQIAHGDFIKN
jgi:Secretion system C-terminal sorting domain